MFRRLSCGLYYDKVVALLLLDNPHLQDPNSISAKSGLEALRAAFETIDNNKLNPTDADWALYFHNEGQIVGVLHAGVGDYYLGIGERTVTICVLAVSAKVRRTYLGGKVGVRLLRLVSEWAKSQKAEEIHIHSTSGIEPERTDRMLTRMGFRTYGGNYVARLG